MAIVTTVKTRRRLLVSSPATLEPIGEIEVMTADDVKAVMEKARKAQVGWGALSFDERGKYMLKALKILIDRQDDFIEMIGRETPKPIIDIVQIEIFPTCDALDYYAKNTAKFLQMEKKELHGVMSMLKEMYVVYQPMGVVGVISPWNGPFVLSIIPTIQALMAGNAVVLKPSSVTPFSGKLVGDLFQAAGLPEGVVNVILGDSETGQALLESGANKISFTGSVEVGRHVAEECARRLIPCTLELGGKDPMIVCADADLNNAAGGAVSGCFVNTGQYCCGTERVYVVESVADEFIRKVVERVRKLRQDSEGEFDVGSTFWPQQICVIEKHIADAVAKGARVLVGGHRNLKLKGIYFEPTVIVDVDHGMSIMREETFGPVIPIMRVRDEEEAISLANDSHFGLSSNVWTKDTAKGLAIGQRIQSGSVNVNDMAITYGVPEAPFGGVKDSGLGRVNGEMGLRSYCNIKPIIIDLFGGAQTANMYPTSNATAKVIQDTIRAMWGNTV